MVLGRSNIVGKPMAMLLLQPDGTVTICHSKTPVDVAMNRNEEGRLCGDVDFAAVEAKASYITRCPAAWDP